MTAPEPWPLYAMPTPVDQLAAEIAELRPLPESAMRITRLTTDDRFSAQELATLIANDPAITARLLRLANSAYYGFPRRISTVRDAVVLVGLRAVRAVVLVACMMDPAAVAPYRSGADARASWRFSVSVGVIAELLARSEGIDAEAAFTAGVLHNIGLVALEQYRPEGMRVAMRIVRSGAQTRHEAERAVFGFTDAELGGALAVRWDFPPDLAAAIGDHARSLAELPAPGSLTACVIRARLFARSHAIPDGVAPSQEAVSSEDGVPAALAGAIGRAGGIAGILRRADAFVEATVG
jgi:HD-like signal output (HDOD) protein